MMEPEPAQPLYVAISVKVGDAAPGVAMDVLVEDLQHMTHDEAALHYGFRPGCMYRAFTGDAGEREELSELLEEMSHPAKASIMAEWDGASRPVVVVHWWEDTPMVIHD